MTNIPKGWDCIEGGHEITSAGPTLAQRFCTMEWDLAAPMVEADKAKWGACMDDSAEVTFSDGSVASCLNGGPWLPCALDAPESVAALAARMVDKGPHIDLAEDLAEDRASHEERHAERDARALAEDGDWLIQAARGRAE